MLDRLKHPYAVELFGTMFLSFTIFFTNNYLLIGLALAIAVYIGGPISGGCFNPAITIASYINNTLKPLRLVPYIIVQIVGGILGFLIAKGILSLMNRKI
jgi:aquaporin Z